MAFYILKIKEFIKNKARAFQYEKKVEVITDSNNIENFASTLMLNKYIYDTLIELKETTQKEYKETLTALHATPVSNRKDLNQKLYDYSHNLHAIEDLIAKYKTKITLNAKELCLSLNLKFVRNKNAK